MNELKTIIPNTEINTMSGESDSEESEDNLEESDLKVLMPKCKKSIHNFLTLNRKQEISFNEKNEEIRTFYTKVKNHAKRTT